MITGEILGLGRDANKNIIVWVAFERVTDDGEGVTVKEPITFYDAKGVILYNGRKAWPLVATGQNFAGRTEAQGWDWVDKGIKYQIGNIIRELTAKEKLVSDAEVLLSGFIGRKVEADKTSYQDSLANNGISDATIEIDETGNVTVK